MIVLYFPNEVTVLKMLWLLWLYWSKLVKITCLTQIWLGFDMILIRYSSPLPIFIYQSMFHPMRADFTYVNTHYTTFIHYPRPVLDFGCCRCLRLSVPSVRPSVRPSVTKFVHAITRQPFKLGSPKLDQICKKTLVKIPIVLWDDWSWPSRSNWTPK